VFHITKVVFLVAAAFLSVKEYK